MAPFGRLVREIAQNTVDANQRLKLVPPRRNDTSIKPPYRLDPLSIDFEQDALTALQFASEHILVMMFDMM